MRTVLVTGASLCFMPASGRDQSNQIPSMSLHASIEPLEWENRFFGIQSAIVRFRDDAPH